MIDRSDLFRRMIAVNRGSDAADDATEETSPRVKPSTIHERQMAAIRRPLRHWPLLEARIGGQIEHALKHGHFTVEDAGMLTGLLEEILIMRFRDPTDAEFCVATRAVFGQGYSNYRFLVSDERNPHSRQAYLHALHIPVYAEFERAWVLRDGRKVSVGTKEWGAIEYILVYLWMMLEQQLPAEELRPKPVEVTSSINPLDMPSPPVGFLDPHRRPKLYLV